MNLSSVVILHLDNWPRISLDILKINVGEEYYLALDSDRRVEVKYAFNQKPRKLTKSVYSKGSDKKGIA